MWRLCFAFKSWLEDCYMHMEQQRQKHAFQAQVYIYIYYDQFSNSVQMHAHIYD